MLFDNCRQMERALSVKTHVPVCRRICHKANDFNGNTQSRPSSEIPLLRFRHASVAEASAPGFLLLIERLLSFDYGVTTRQVRSVPGYFLIERHGSFDHGVTPRFVLLIERQQSFNQKEPSRNMRSLFGFFFLSERQQSFTQKEPSRNVRSPALAAG